MRYAGAIVVLVLAATANAAAAGRDSYEVWAIDQSNSPGKTYGGTLYIWGPSGFSVGRDRGPRSESRSPS